ncbi:MAG: sigma 54-interacting transcriptional regulator [Myxococcota bacterium]
MLSSSTTHEAKHRILLAEDEQNVRKVIAAHLRRSGFEVVEAHNAPTAREVFKQNPVDLVLTDLKMPDSEQDGFEVLRYVCEQTPKDQPQIPVLILTAHGTAEKALEALSQGAYTLISKPCDMRELLAQVRIAIQQRTDALETLRAKQAADGRFGVIGKTPVLQSIFDTIGRVADTPATVLISGESGTGKELIARALHFNSSRANNPFIRLNCAAIPENLVESELFGHERGAFTGAVANKPGRFEQAHTGTLFLDELGELKPDVQVKLLRALAEQEFERVGGVRTLKVDVRVIAATNRDLAAQVKNGQFREDLFYRLNVVSIRLPPLRERVEDIPLLVEHFLGKFNKRLGKSVSGVDRTLQELLRRYSWPGNIRELENVVERMVLFSDSNLLSVRHMPAEVLNRLREDDHGKVLPPVSLSPHVLGAAPMGGVPVGTSTSASGTFPPVSVATFGSAAPTSAPAAAASATLASGASASAASASVAAASASVSQGHSALTGAHLGGAVPSAAHPEPSSNRGGSPVLAPGAVFAPTSEPSRNTPVDKDPAGALSLKDLVRERTLALERDLILQAFESCSWNVTRTAERLGLSRKGLQVKMKELDIRKPGS